MRRVSAALSLLGFGLLTQHAHAEGTQPRAAKSVDRALPSASSSSLRLLRFADVDRDARVSYWELESFLFQQVLLQVEQRMQRLDRNDDGQVTQSEVPNMPAARFARFDLNGDGAFTLWELSRVMRQQAIERCRTVFARMDADRNGQLTMSDFESGQPERVAKAPRNVDTDANRAD